eukprot:gene4912-889_t
MSLSTTLGSPLGSQRLLACVTKYLRNETFPLRYLVDDTFGLPGGPLIVYTGNEGDVWDFANNTGMAWVIAERSNGVVVFIEERYYGASVPVQGRRYEFLSSAQDLVSLIGWAQAQYGALAVQNYPYPVDFAGRSLPAHPPLYACSLQAQAPPGDLLAALAASLTWLLPQGQCLDLSPFPSYYPGFIPGAWTYQRCTEIAMPVAVSEGNCMMLPCSVFPSNCWDPVTLQQAITCWLSPGNALTSAGSTSLYWGTSWASDIEPHVIFTNGVIDPWSSGGMFCFVCALQCCTEQPYNISIWISGAAHHLDLRAPHPDDPASVTKVREQLLLRLLAEAGADNMPLLNFNIFPSHAPNSMK